MKIIKMILVSVVILTSFVHAGRSVVTLDPQWQFNRSDISGAQAIAYDDSSWDTVNVPHSYNAFDGEDGGSYYRGPAWYRKSVSIPQGYEGKCVYLFFESVGRAADVYCNGKYVGRHVGAYAAFTFDVSDFLSYGKENVIAVRVDNSDAFRIAPVSGDFTQWGGICRKVSMVVTDPVHITLEDYASCGVYLTTTNVSDESAELKVKTLVRNAGSSGGDYKVNITVLDDDGKTVADMSASTIIASGRTVALLTDTVIEEPHLWNGLKDPYLYQVVVDVLDGDELLDSVIQPLGLRYYTVDKNKGFLLNGSYYDLHGAAIHEDREDKGRAISDQDRREDFSLMREMGCNWLRLSHYQHSELMYDMADSEGVVLYTEIPLINRVGSKPFFGDNACQQLTELIRQNYNHPSIFFWGVFNEINMNSKGPDPVPLVTQLHHLAKSEDPTRLTIAAACCDDNAPTTYITDTICYNKYFGWYNDDYDHMSVWADNHQKARPDAIFGISEYGAGAGVNQHELNPAQPSPGGRWHPEEYQALFHEKHWIDMKTRPFIWNKTIWNGFNFASDWRNEGERSGINDKGMVTRDRKVKKDSFMWYKANWNPEPMVYITSRRNTPLYTDEVYVKVYSNCDSVELYVNGNSAGTMEVKDCIAIWQGIKLSAGENKVVAIAKNNGKAIKDSCSWEVISGRKLAVKKVTASSENGNEVAANTIDGSAESRWAAEGSQSIVFDLGKKSDVDAMHIIFYNGAQRMYKFSVECSNDNKKWKTVAPELVSSGKSPTYESFDLNECRARYIRLNGKGNNTSSWNSYNEVLFLGK